jgi:hypothetical protein
MPFIGQQPVTGAYHKLDSITTSATATYNLLLNGGAYSPASANHLLVSLNGVMQAPQDSFTVSGSQITFASALTSSDNIDFIMALGDVLNIGTPSDGSVNTSQLADGGVTTAKINDANITDAKLASTLDLSGKTVTYGLTDSDMPSGSVIQVVQAQYSTQISTSDTNDFDIITVNITPQSASSKFLVHGEVMGVERGTTGGARLLVRLKRDSANIHSSDANFYTQDTQQLRHGGFSISQLDSPATTSQITYKLVGKWSNHSSPSYVNKDGNSGSSTITVMEIVG